jgi:hypothetical protein
MINFDMGLHDGQETIILNGKPPEKRPLGKLIVRSKDGVRCTHIFEK